MNYIGVPLIVATAGVAETVFFVANVHLVRNDCTFVESIPVSALRLVLARSRPNFGQSSAPACKQLKLKTRTRAATATRAAGIKTADLCGPDSQSPILLLFFINPQCPIE